MPGHYLAGSRVAQAARGLGIALAVLGVRQRWWSDGSGWVYALLLPSAKTSRADPALFFIRTWSKIYSFPRV